MRTTRTIAAFLLVACGGKDGGKQVALADHIVEVARPQPGRERRASRQALFGSGGEQVVSHRRDPILGDL